MPPLAVPAALAHRPRNTYENSPLVSSTLSKPFTPPLAKRASVLPARKKRKTTSYVEDAEDTTTDKDTSYTTCDNRIVLGGLDINALKARRRESGEVFRKEFIVPVKENGGMERRVGSAPSLGMLRPANFVARPLHDPAGEFAIVLYDPTIDDEPLPKIPDGTHILQQAIETDVVTEIVEEKVDEVKKESKVHKSLAEILGIPKRGDVREQPKVAVVIDPKIAKVLRPHQIEGVKFLYKATTGKIHPDAYGCIMADEMGLGKTLQCITLLYTLLRQSPTPPKRTIQKCIIACPSSLVRNWANELDKWLGKGTIVPLAVDGKGGRQELEREVRAWCEASGRNVVKPVMIVSYESLRLNVDLIGQTPIGLMLCDEGHRLKNGDSQTFTALSSLNVQRRVILSGTPIQNDLSEYYSLLSFANPNLLGTRQEFRSKYELAILKGRDALASEVERQRGDEKLSELLGTVNKFIIRRTNDILSKYLPVKYEHVVFVHLSPLQKSLYNYFLTSPEITKLLRGKGSQPLKAIGLLKKLCNHPDLLDLHTDLAGCEKLLPEEYSGAQGGGRNRDVNCGLSGKMAVLERMLARIRKETNDKIVLISNYTQTLDIFEKMCRARRYGCLRLDGTMNVNKRQKLVDKFNDPEGPEFVFLLSSKAGGCGLNLIGANRLILFDPDWNPAADQQALARVWRDGQKKDCFVYRFIATGTIEEKIFQRQSHKQSLSSCVVDSAEDVERHFSLSDLRTLFKYNENTNCETHETFKCKRCKNGKQVVKAPAFLYGDTSSWNHFENEALSKIEDLLLRQETGGDCVSAVFQYISH